MSKEKFEQLVAFHCAPTLLGAKPASLISFQKSKHHQIHEILAEYEACFKCKGIGSITMMESENYLLVLFYRRDKLEETLERKSVMDILIKIGYWEHDTVEEHLNYLKTRMLLRKTFPHEIGLFLGYPPEDVVGFIENGGKNFSYSGYWKVYANEAETRKLFDYYTACTHDFCENLNKGIPMVDLLPAV